VARIFLKDKKSRHVGWFQDELCAAGAYDRVARELLGDKATLNFPDQAPESAVARAA
jgi:hypothetical protein